MYVHVLMDACQHHHNMVLWCWGLPWLIPPLVTPLGVNILSFIHSSDLTGSFMDLLHGFVRLVIQDLPDGDFTHKDLTGEPRRLYRQRIPTDRCSSLKRGLKALYDTRYNCPKSRKRKRVESFHKRGVIWESVS